MSESGDDLTTDAIPSAPRDETQKEERKGSENVNIPPKVKIKGKSCNKKTKKNAPTAFASVINISNANGIHVGSNYNVYLANKTQSQQHKDYIITDAITAMFSNNDSVETKHLIFLSQHINEEWRNIGRLLDYSEGQISQFYENHSKTSIKEVIYQMLLDWIQNEAECATIGRLAKTLWETNQQDAVTRWSENFGK